MSHPPNKKSFAAGVAVGVVICMFIITVIAFHRNKTNDPSLENAMEPLNPFNWDYWSQLWAAIGSATFIVGLSYLTFFGIPKWGKSKKETTSVMRASQSADDSEDERSSFVKKYVDNPYP